MLVPLDRKTTAHGKDNDQALGNGNAKPSASHGHCHILSKYSTVPQASFSRSTQANFLMSMMGVQAQEQTPKNAISLNASAYRLQDRNKCLVEKN